MRLLKLNGSHDLNFTENLSDNHRPPYAILSHTWGPSKSEVSLDDINSGRASEKAAYDKIEFCKRQCQIDGIQHFWIDTCCINQMDLNELTESINSMFRWYRDATKCYVYLPDVSTRKRGLNQEKPQWESQFQNSRWFTRGWTLQELLAPSTVDFFSREGDWLGNRTTLQWMIYKATAISTAALNGTPIEKFSIEERMSWSAQRNTTKKEDKAYCLLGLFGVYMPLIYGEGDYAFIRLKKIIEDQYGSKCVTKYSCAV
ncbi:HET-domain-containing protein [Corynespora cassiicola Philippines]|uniref:HET-domain-containing protein n=1 Tax=Corynespora cassiicola Philippines TaxID=1448308 RepID=A0A2T2NBN8_CORCC|nr:HET-domain-containing protein [Corynespora cassiicola Philippines]